MTLLEVEILPPFSWASQFSLAGKSRKEEVVVKINTKLLLINTVSQVLPHSNLISYTHSLSRLYEKIVASNFASK